LIRRRRP